MKNMKHLKLLIITFTFFLVLFALTPQVRAAAYNVTQDKYGAPQQAHYILLNIMSGLICEIIGRTILPNQLCVAYTDQGLKLFDLTPNQGAMGTMNSAMLAMYQSPPASTELYLADLGTNLGVVKPAYAQNVGGSGNAVLSVILRLWQATRNIAYLGFILIFVAVGFMIMFRTRINPQTVVTVQQALPGLIVGLVLVTFSYLIAALTVDLSFLTANLVALLFQSSFPGDRGLTNLVGQSNVFQIFTAFMFGTGALSELVAGFAKLFAGAIVYDTSAAESLLKNTSPILQAIAVVVPQIMNFITGLATGAIGGVVGVLVAFVIIIALFIQMIRLVFALTIAYINIFVFTILGPIFILFASLPGRGEVLGFWWRNLLGNVIVFPTVFAAFLFAGAILAGVDWTPNAALPLFGGLNDSLLKAILAIGIVLGTPGIPKAVRDAVGAKGISGIPEAAQRGLIAGATVGAVATSVPAGSAISWIRERRKENP